MTRPLLLVLALATLGAPPARAQGSRPLIKYGKWVLAAGAVSMNLLAARAHDDAEEAFDRIEDACAVDRIRCIVNVEGRYADAEIESLYQNSLHHDRVARRWLIFGETALVGAAAMFVWELTRASHEPDNIPFEPEVKSLRNATGLGVRIAW
ncbi:MAG TPA: hypothetical protein VFT84_03570 [Gemmatimonadales bacterium]|nr:hypothetical protein [Gemmatimonadales bacterium]